MRSIVEVRNLLDRLDEICAGELEDQDLDFKTWNPRSMADAVALAVEAAVCMANGGGGTVVFGVDDKLVGRSDAILGVPPEVNVNRLRRAIYDQTDPKLTPVIETLTVPEGTGRLLIMQIHGGLAPYTDSAGRAKVRVGTDCQPLTGSMRHRITVETGENDFTDTLLPGPPSAYFSSAALEQLRSTARRERAPEELLRQTDLDLLGTLGLIRSGQLTRAGLLLAGSEEKIREYVPGYAWTYFAMRSETKYSNRADGAEAIPIALDRIGERIMAANPVETIERGLFHFEYRTYPEIALREALLNAFCHRDFQLAGPVLVKQFPNTLRISNPGGFIGGISPDNVLHHIPVDRNPRLAEALIRLRLVNRGNLGIARMYSAMLMEGKEPPLITEKGNSVIVRFTAGQFSSPMRTFVAEEESEGRLLTVDHLIILRYLLRHPEIDTSTAARICQRIEVEAREILSEMEVHRGYIERGGAGSGTYWMLRSELHRRLAGPGDLERDQRIDWEAAKTRVLSILRQRSRRSQKGLSNAEVRAITHLDRHQVVRLMNQLREETNGQVDVEGKRKGARWVFFPGTVE